MNVYDFDKTIYKSDCTVDFIIYTFKKNPICFLSLPKIILYGILFKLCFIKKTFFKEKLFSYFKHLNNIDKIVDEFVDINLYKIKKFYYQNQKDNDLVISASPYFLVNAFCKKIGIKNVMGSNVDKYTGKYDGENCYGEEKVNRFKKAYPSSKIEEFYSDSYSDTPLALISEKAYIVLDEKIIDWKF